MNLPLLPPDQAAPHQAHAMAPRHECELGPLLLDIRSETIFRQGSPLQIGRRAVSLLICLLRQPGAIVAKETLMQAGWNNLAVEESNLATQISALRKAIAAQGGCADWIETLPRRGYRYTGPVTWRRPADSAVAWSEAPHHTPQPDDNGPASIAVMPFTLGDPALATFADGLCEDVVSMLASLRELVVISRASTLAAHGRTPNPVAAGLALGVRYLVSGHIRETGQGLRITVELAEPATARAIWSRHFDTSLTQAPTAPAPVFATIVNTIAPRVREQEIRRLQARALTDLTAHQLVLKARLLIATQKREALLEAKPLIDQAIARDPSYASAHELAANWHSLMISQAWTADREADLAALEVHGMRAIALDGTNAGALARVGHARALHHRDYEGARALLDRALDAGPNFPKVWELSSFVMSWLGDGEAALRHAERAMQLSPFDPYGSQVFSTLCLAQYTRGDYAAALGWARRAHAEFPRQGSHILYGAASAAAAGNLEAARAMFGLFQPNPQALSAARIVARHPYRDEARRIRYGEHLMLAGCPG